MSKSLIFLLGLLVSGVLGYATYLIFDPGCQPCYTANCPPCDRSLQYGASAIIFVMLEAFFIMLMSKADTAKT